MQAYRAGIAQMPLRADEHPSKLRRVASALAGVGAGISGGPEAGEKTATEVRDQPYNRKLQNYQQKLGVQGQEAQLEAGGNQAARQYYLDLAKVSSENTKSQANLAQREAEKSRAGYFGARADVARYGMSPEGQAAAIKLAQARIRPPGVQVPWKVVTKDGKEITGELQPGGAFKAPDGTIIPAENIDLDKTNKLGTKEPNAPQQSEFTAFSTDYKQRHPNANMEEVSRAFAAAKEQPQRPPQGLAIGPDGRAQLVRPGTQVAPGSRTLTEEGQLNTPTSATRARGEAAQSAVAAGNDIIDFATANRDSLGHVDNYWKQIMSNTPVADPVVNHFNGKVASWAALQAAAHGMRASTIMKEFEDRVGRGPKSVDAVIAAIQGVNEGLSHVIDTGKGQTGGNSLPGGVTLEEINAELARRKNGRPQSAK